MESRVRVANPSPLKGEWTFRARGVPLDWDKDHLRSFLSGQDDSAGPIIRSLAVEVDGRRCTATVTFQNIPRRLQTPQARRGWQISLPTPSDQSNRPCLTLDDDFIGITTLFAPPPQDHKVE